MKTDHTNHIAVLAAATEPQAAGRLSRADFVNVHVALSTLSSVLEEFDKQKTEIERLSDVNKNLQRVVMQETESRMKAEERAAQETENRAKAEERVARLEAELAQLRGAGAAQ